MLSPSSIVAAFALDVIAAAAPGSILLGAEVLDSKFQEITQDKGIVVSNSEWDFVNKQMMNMSFSDALVIVGFYYRVPGADTSERATARDKCFEMAEAFAQAVFNDFYLKGASPTERVCDSVLMRAVDGNDNTNSDSFAIVNLPIILNPTGRLDTNLGDAK